MLNCSLFALVRFTIASLSRRHGWWWNEFYDIHDGHYRLDEQQLHSTENSTIKKEATSTAGTTKSWKGCWKECNQGTQSVYNKNAFLRQYSNLWTMGSVYIRVFHGLTFNFYILYVMFHLQAPLNGLWKTQPSGNASSLIAKRKNLQT